MKLLIRASVAILLVTSAFAGPGSLQDFLNDPQVAKLAPNLVSYMNTHEFETSANTAYYYNNLIVPETGEQVPLLQDLIAIASQLVFSSKDNKDADWSRLEAAKLKAIQSYGEAGLESANLTAIDIQRASLIVNTIYDTVLQLPLSSKALYEDKAAEASTSPFWRWIGSGLIKSSDVVKNIKSVVSPANQCVTDNEAYLDGAEEAIYYSSLADGLVGGAPVAMPNDPTANSLSLGTIVTSVGKLAIEIHMAQSVARSADLNPNDEAVRAMVYLGLAADSLVSDYALTAKDLLKLKSHKLIKKVPDSATQALEQQAAIVLVTKGAGRVDGQRSFPQIPMIRNLFAFSNGVLNASKVGDVLKNVFCPVKNDEGTENLQATDADLNNTVDEGQKSAEDVKPEEDTKPEENAKSEDADAEDEDEAVGDENAENDVEGNDSADVEQKKGQQREQKKQ
ncbi:hypothetical protein BX616_005436 [Lobosporangium transversale]|uniref:Uncharacterized protein n=1 Tax=Lobosporangium transversale TaxID=64571 RepID=A0A1Y2GG77_9FUNG|nr:hypothetical protein BCR41DRAFT_358935 [Lobosporangium transversale]KAF9918822.1 hypothetical protein BX616_005436 [Lobosporangium transversale]ORZ08736.1 hypothetical protein BCR41DRAFT_358935 [Lobosporangium transversale]|eukprot:XP_021878519.1 hypothetical protein BCR41DRAFT_358935 [Lobosporangium transversale]